MTILQSVRDRPAAGTPDGLRSADVISLPAHAGIAFGEHELKAMRSALDKLSARFGIRPDSAEYQAAAVTIVRIASAGHIDVSRVVQLAGTELGLNRIQEA